MENSILIVYPQPVRHQASNLPVKPTGQTTILARQLRWDAVGLPSTADLTPGLFTANWLAAHHVVAIRKSTGRN